MKDKPKVIHLKIEQDIKMIISQWAIFIIGMVFIACMFVPIIKIITTYQDNGIKLGLLILFIFALIKVVHFIKVPSTYSTNDIIQEIRLELNRK